MPKAKSYVKSHARIHTSIGNHRKTADVYASNDLLACYVRILLLGIERFADRYDDSFILHSTEICRITGSGRMDSAVRLLGRLCDVSPILARRLDDVPGTSRGRQGYTWLITIPNFAKKQGFGSRKGTLKGAPSTSTSTSPSTSPFKNLKPCHQGAKTMSELPPVGRQLSENLIRLMLLENEKYKVPKGENELRPWALEYDRMMRIDKREESDIQAQQEWLFTLNARNEARFVVHSPKTHRKKFDRISGGMQDPGESRESQADAVARMTAEAISAEEGGGDDRSKFDDR